MPAARAAAKHVVPADQVALPVADSMKLLFRREVANMLTLPPHLSDVDADGKPIEVEVVAAIERLASSGQQQSIQLCRAGDVSWVTRTEGDRAYFPLVGRVSKRIRDADDDEHAEGAPAAAAKTGAKKRKAPVKKAAAAAKAPATPDMAGAKRATPKAPKKHKRQPPIVEEDDEDEDEPATPLETNAAMRQRVEEALGRGKRHARSGRKGDSADVVVKAEENDEHDLESLCGGVGGLDVKSAIDAESVYSASRAGSVQLPIASTSKLLA
ncbi:hypothetical protein RQP46_001820 [Phenoliferia psychrophenolica]